MKKIILSILLFNFLNSYSQISKELEDHIKPFEKINVFNAMGRTNDSIINLLNKKATEEELVYLSLNGINTFTKGISIESLIKRKSKKIFDVFENLIDSKDTLVYSSDCLSSSASLPNFIFQSMTFNRNYSKEEIISNKEILVRKILNKNPININLLESINYWIPQNEEFYKQIRELVIENKSTALLVTIAKYRKTQDIQLIKSFGIDALPAIEEFPNDQFREILENNIKFDDFQYMFALAKSCTPETVKTVEKAVQLKIEDLKDSVCGNYCLSTIYNQIEMNKCELFYPVLEKMWLTNKIISYHIYENYKSKHSKIETKNFLFSGLMLKGKAEIIHKNIYDDTDFINSMNSGLTWNKTAKLVHILNELKKYSNEDYLKALKNNIIQIEDLLLPNFVEDLKDNKSLIINKEAFIEKLKSNEKAYGLLVIMEAIKLLGDKETFDKGFEVIKTRREDFKKVPGWEYEFQKFLKENNLKLD